MRQKEMKPYKASLILLTLLLFTLQNSSFAFIYGKKINQGNKLYRKQNYSGAEIKYRDVLSNKKDLPAIFNLGNSLYRQGRYEESEKYFNTVANEEKNTKLKQKAFYNQGNAQFRQQNYEGAIKSYEEALKLNPKDEDAKYNLELAKKMLELPKNKNQQQKQNQQNSKQPEEDKNKSSKGGDKNNQQKSSSNTSPDKTLPKEDAERLLKSIEDQLKHKNPGQDKTQLKTRGVSKIEKDW